MLHEGQKLSILRDFKLTLIIFSLREMITFFQIFLIFYRFSWFFLIWRPKKIRNIRKIRKMVTYACNFSSKSLHFQPYPNKFRISIKKFENHTTPCEIVSNISEKEGWFHKVVLTDHKIVGVFYILGLIW